MKAQPVKAIIYKGGDLLPHTHIGILHDAVIAEARAYIADDRHDYVKCRRLLKGVLAMLPSGQLPPLSAEVQPATTEASSTLLVEHWAAQQAQAIATDAPDQGFRIYCQIRAAVIAAYAAGRAGTLDPRP